MSTEATRRKRVVVVCPGRGSYTKETLGYYQKALGEASPGTRDALAGFMHDLDDRRRAVGEPTITELDTSSVFKTSVHTRGEHASHLIYAASLADFELLNREKYEVVAVCGNSMGWYLTLAFSGALDQAGAFHLIQTMGSMMKEAIVGGQMIYPIVDADWKIDPRRRALVDRCIREVNWEGRSEITDDLGADVEGARPVGEIGSSDAHVEISIQLGGYVVVGGTPEGLKQLMSKLPKDGDYPFQLINHAAFHTSLLEETSRRAFELIGPEIFHRPRVPMIDGRGHIWQPYSTDASLLYEYTLGHQVYKPYDFTTSVAVALKEFAPDHLVLLGPGSSLGGSLGQIMVKNKWQNIESKADFVARQKSANPALLAMGLPDQRKLALSFD